MQSLDALLRCIVICAVVCILAAKSWLFLPAGILFASTALLEFLWSESELRTGRTKKFALDRKTAPVRFWWFVSVRLALASCLAVIGVVLLIPA